MVVKIKQPDGQQPAAPASKVRPSPPPDAQTETPASLESSDGQQPAAPATPDAQEVTAETPAAMVAKMLAVKAERMELLKAIKKADSEEKRAERAKKVRRLSCELPIELMDALEQRAKDEKPKKTVTRIVIKAIKHYLDTPLPEPMPDDHLKVLLSDK